MCWILSQSGQSEDPTDALQRLGESYGREVERRSPSATVFVTELSYVLIGIFLGFVINALFLPILGLSSLVG